MLEFKWKVMVVNDYLLMAMPAIEKAVLQNNGKIVCIEYQTKEININREIKRHRVNLLILAIGNKGSICKLLRDVKEKHPSIMIITIAKRVKQIPILIKTKMIEAIILASEDISQLIQAIKNIVKGQNYYSPKVSQEMANEIAKPRLTPREKEIAKPRLTPREKEIAILLNENISRIEISRRLKITYATVSTHVRNIEKKKKKELSNF